MSIMSRYQSNPNEEHWMVVKNILKYLKRTKNLFLAFGRRSELQVEGYTDSKFMSDPNDIMSTSRYAFVCNDGTTSWRSPKQSIIANSMMEAKYVAALDAAKKVFWYKKFITKFYIMTSNAITLYCDNNDAIALAKESKSHQKFKYIE